MKCHDDVLCYANILVSSVYRWTENFFSVFDKASLMEAAPAFFDFYKYIMARYKST